MNKNNYFSKNDLNELIHKSAEKIFFKKDVNIDIKSLHWDYNQFRIRKWDIRIIFKITDNNEILVEILVIKADFRWNIYKN